MNYDNIYNMGFDIFKYKTYKWTDSNNMKNIIELMDNHGVSNADAVKIYRFLHDKVDNKINVMKTIDRSDTYSLMLMLIDIINKHDINAAITAVRLITNYNDYAKKYFTGEITLHIINDYIYKLNNNPDYDYFNGIDDYIADDNGLDNSGIYNAYAGYAKPESSKQKRYDETDNRSWYYAYSCRGISDFEATKNKISRTKLHTMLQKLHDNKKYAIMMALGDCIIACNNGKQIIDNKNINYKWLSSMNDYPAEFIKQAISGTAVNANINDYKKYAYEIVKQDIFLDNYYIENLLRVRKGWNGCDTISTCNVSWIAHNYETVHLMSENIKIFNDNMYSVYSDNSTMNKIMDAVMSTFLSYKPYCSSSISTNKTMDYYKIAFHDAITTRRFTAWCWMIMLTAVVNDDFRDELDKPSKLLKEEKKAPANPDTSIMQAYLYDGIIPDEYLGAKIDDTIKLFMQRVLDTDNDVNLHDIMRSILNESNDVYMKAMIGSFVKRK